MITLKYYKLVAETNISDSDHLLINILKTKNIFADNHSLNIYGGKLKEEGKQ
ncbi:hypothetical protein [Candidatus Phytoplasma australiense]|uniref:hypothetical protein n=1 Tax=Phytoplasma australiense TaxID=59748 RepID=UPI0002ED849D|nr:hypothetical protein [Candidatus Phytoplasma australiense]